MGIVLGVSNCVNKMHICNIPVTLFPFPTPQQPVLVKLNGMCPDLTQLWQLHCMVLPCLPGTSYALCCSCCVKFIHSIPRPPILP